MNAMNITANLLNALGEPAGPISPAAKQNKDTTPKAEPPREYRFQAYPYDTPRAGGTNIHSINKIVSDFALDPVFSSLGFESSAFGRILRLAADVPMAGYSHITQHEYFGHAYAAGRNGWDTDVSIGMFSGYTSWRTNGDFFTDDQIFAVTYGTTASTILADDVIAADIFRNGGSAPDLPLYFLAKTDISRYILNDPDGPGDLDSGSASSDSDVVNYMFLMEQLASGAPVGRDYDRGGAGSFGGSGVSDGSLTAAAVWNLMDPTLIYLALSTLKYVKDGSRSIDLPNGLPIFSSRLTINGPEGRLIVPIRYEDMIFRPYGRVSQFGSCTSYGAGIDVSDIPVTEKVSVDLGAHYWQQRTGAGYMVTGDMNAQLADGMKVGLGGYYKSNGDIAGYTYDEEGGGRATLTLW